MKKQTMPHIFPSSWSFWLILVSCHIPCSLPKPSIQQQQKFMSWLLFNCMLFLLLSLFINKTNNIQTSITSQLPAGFGEVRCPPFCVCVHETKERFLILVAIKRVSLGPVRARNCVFCTTIRTCTRSLGPPL